MLKLLLMLLYALEILGFQYNITEDARRSGCKHVLYVKPKVPNIYDNWENETLIVTSSKGCKPLCQIILTKPVLFACFVSIRSFSEVVFIFRDVKIKTPTDV